jgi:cytochrome b involved in lipid metabolism
MPHQSLTRAEVQKNSTEDSLWLIIDSKVYDVTDFLDAHPGGESVLKQVAGQDATEAFYNLHRQEVLQKYSNLCIGTLEVLSTQINYLLSPVEVWTPGAVSRAGSTTMEF